MIPKNRHSTASVLPTLSKPDCAFHCHVNQTEPCLRTDSNHHHGFQLRHRERPAARQRLEQEQEYRTVDDELGDNDRKRGNALEFAKVSRIPGPHQGDPALPSPQNCTKTPIKADKVDNTDDSKLIAIFPNWNKSSF